MLNIGRVVNNLANFTLYGEGQGFITHIALLASPPYVLFKVTPNSQHELTQFISKTLNPVHLCSAVPVHAHSMNFSIIQWYVPFPILFTPCEYITGKFLSFSLESFQLQTTEFT